FETRLTDERYRIRLRRQARRLATASEPFGTLGAYTPRMNHRRHMFNMAGLATLVLATAACESENPDIQSEPVSQEEAELRDRAGLHPTASTDPQAQTPEALKDQVDVISDGKKPDSAAEMREEMDLEPEEPEENE